MAPRPRTRLDPDLRREQILDAATAIFRVEEFSSVSLDSVAARAGVTRGLVHHYFGSKRGVYLAVVARAVQIPASARLVPDGASGTLAEVLAECVESWMRLIESAGGLWPGSAGGGGFASGDVDEILAAARDELVDRMIAELPLPESLDRELLRPALRAFAAFARVATDEWLVARSLTRPQASTLLHAALVSIVEDAVPLMGDR